MPGEDHAHSNTRGRHSHQMFSCFSHFRIFAFSQFSCMKIPKKQFTFFTRFPCPISTFPCPMTHVSRSKFFLTCHQHHREFAFSCFSWNNIHNLHLLYIRIITCTCFHIRFHVLSFSNPRNGVDITATPKTSQANASYPKSTYISICTSPFKASREVVVNLNLPEFQIMKKQILGCTEFTTHRDHEQSVKLYIYIYICVCVCARVCVCVRVRVFTYRYVSMYTYASLQICFIESAHWQIHNQPTIFNQGSQPSGILMCFACAKYSRVSRICTWEAMG